MKNQKQETKQKKQEKQEQKEPTGHFQAWLKKEITKFVLIPNSLAKIYKNIYNFSILDIFYK